MREKPSLMPIVIVALVMSLIFSAAAEAQSNSQIGKTMLEDFVSLTAGWWAPLQDYALYVFKITAMLEVALFGIRMVLQKSEIHEVFGQFVMLMLFMCFIAAVIMNYKEWAETIAIKGLQEVVRGLSPNGIAADAGSPVAIIFVIIDTIIPIITNTGPTQIPLAILWLIGAFALVVIFAIICCRYILVICEFHIVANAGIILIGLGGSKIFKEYAISVMRYILSLGVKVFVIQLILNMGFSLIKVQGIAVLSTGVGLENLNFFIIIEMIIKGIILLALAMILPSTCAGLLSGASVDGGNPLGKVGGAVASKGLAVATGGASAVISAAKMAGNAHTVAGGMKGGATFGNMRKAFSNARSDAKTAGEQDKISKNPGSISNQLQSKANAVRAGNAAGGGDSAGGGQAPVDMTKPPQSK